MRWPALAFLLMLPGLAAGQEVPRVGIRGGDHPTYGRIVFDWPRQVGYRLERQGDRMVLHFDAPASFDLGVARRLPRNFRALEAEASSVTVTLAEGVTPRVFRLGTRVVVDASLEPAQAAPPVRSAEPARSTPQQAAPATTPRATPPRPPPQPRATTATARRGAPPAAAPSASPPQAAALAIAAPPPRAPILTEPLSAPSLSGSAAGGAPSGSTPAAAPVMARAAAPQLRPDGSVLVPAPAGVGAALFQRSGLWLFVLDAPVALDAAGLATHPRLAGTVATMGPAATTLRIPAAAFAHPQARRVAEGWVIDAPQPPPASRSLLPEVEAADPPRLVFRSAGIGSSLAVLDPETGGVLLVGTLREGSGAVPIGRRSATVEILPTRLGIALAPRADSLSLRGLEDRFVLDTAPGTVLALGARPGAPLVDAANLSRHFDLPAEGLGALQDRLRNATSAIAAAPPLGRGQPRMRAAEALLALGLAQEAQAMANLALREDPRLAEQPRARALGGAAALAAGRIAEAQGLRAPGLPDTDEAGLWQALLAAAEGQAVDAQRLLAGMPLLLSYPEPLVARLLPLATEALVDVGERSAARSALAGRPDDDRSLAFARARLLEAEGETEAALAAYAAVAQGRDRLARARAIRRGAELRLATGRADAAATAAAVETTLAAWRGDTLESEARLRVAALRQQAGDPRGAFTALQEAEALFPELAPRLRPMQVAALLGVLQSDAPIPAIALFDAHHTLLPPGPDGEAAVAALADRLAALDLPDRAQAVLRRALERAAGDEVRARIGERLATLALSAGDPAAAEAALAETEGNNLPDALVTQRLLLAGRAAHRAGAEGRAIARFREAGQAGLADLAEVLAAQQDWPAAAAAMARLREATSAAAPASLDEAGRRLLLRHAALLALAGDEAGLTALREAESPRMAEGPHSEAFALITGGRLQGSEDLPRLRQELELARAVPAGLETLRAGGVTAR